MTSKMWKGSQITVFCCMIVIQYPQCHMMSRDVFSSSVDAGFDKHDIPYDVLWLDIEHTNGKRYKHVTVDCICI